MALHYGATFAYARVGARWYVKVTMATEDGTQRFWSDPLRSREEAIKHRDELRESFIAEMSSQGFGAIVVDDPPTGGTA